MLSSLVTVRIWSFHLAKQRFCRCCDHSIHYVALMTRVQNDSSAVLRTPVLTHVQCTSSKQSIHLALRCHFSLHTGCYAGCDGTYCPLKLDALLRRRAAPALPALASVLGRIARENSPLDCFLVRLTPPRAGALRTYQQNLGGCTLPDKTPHSPATRPPGGQALPLGWAICPRDRERGRIARPTNRFSPYD
jgi:hypothetical protein